MDSFFFNFSDIMWKPTIKSTKRELKHPYTTSKVELRLSAISFLETTGKPPKLPKSTAPASIGGSSVATATMQRSISSSQSQSTTTDYKPHTIKGSTTIVLNPFDGYMAMF